MIDQIFQFLETTPGVLATITMWMGFVGGWVIRDIKKRPGSNKQHDE